MIPDNMESLHALPVGIIPVQGGVILKRGCTEFRIEGIGVEEVIRKVFAAAESPTGATRADLSTMFDHPERSTIDALIEQLVLRRLLVANVSPHKIAGEKESSEDIFFWHFASTQKDMAEHIGSKRIAILGANNLSRDILSALSLAGIKDIRFIDYLPLGNPNSPDILPLSTFPVAPDATVSTPDDFNGTLFDSLDCLIATSDFGFTPAMGDINRYCVSHKRHFLPVILHNMVGYVGPFVVADETPCYECLHRRMGSHLDEPELHLAIQAHSYATRHLVGAHPLMLSLLAQIAVFELLKCYGDTIPADFGTLIEVRLLASRMESRKVLKLPRCPVCGPLLTRPSTTLRKSMFTFAEPGEP